MRITPEVLMALLLAFSAMYLAVCFRQVFRDLFPRRNRRRLFTRPGDRSRWSWIRRAVTGGLDWLVKGGAR